MTTKAEKPTLQGQRIKSRKRDEKAKYDPTAFRDALLVGLIESKTDLEAASKFLDSAGSKLDYRTYGETLFDILIAGGILNPGGVLSEDGAENGPISTDLCIFGAPDDSIETLKAYTQIFTRLMRRYKYLEKIFFEEMKKVLVYLKGFKAENRVRLARCSTMWITDSLLDPKVLTHLIQDHLIKDGLAIDFLCEVLITCRSMKDAIAMKTILRKSSLDVKLMEFLPANKRNQDNLYNAFKDKNLEEIMDVHISFQKETSLKALNQYLKTQIMDNNNQKDIVKGVSKIAAANSMPEHQIITAVWQSIMHSVEWNKKEELVAEQALRHLKLYTPLFAAFTTSARAEVQLLLRIQEYCYENMNFMKVFQKIVFLFYKAEVLSEELIIRWYKEFHSPKGKTFFLNQMKDFVEWLQNAETESEEESEEEKE